MSGSTTSTGLEAGFLSDEQLRTEWRAAGGSIHGPHVETVTMPEASYFAFRRQLAALVADQVISLKEAWDAAGGNPGIKPSRVDLLEALQAMNEAIDAADRWPAAPLAWATEDSNQANAEGWDVFDSTSRGLEIERVDVPEEADEPVFASDDQAIAHVYARAQEGSALHQKALLLTLTRMKDFAWPSVPDGHADTVNAQPPEEIIDPSITVATPAAPEFGASWQISQNLTDRWGEINNHNSRSKPLGELQFTPGLLERLREQMVDEITFVVRKDGRFGVLFEIEYTSIESDGDNPCADKLLPYDVMVARLLAHADRLSRQFPQVEFAVPNKREVVEGRPAIWGFAPDGALTSQQREELGQKLLSFAYGDDMELEPEEDGGMRP